MSRRRSRPRASSAEINQNVRALEPSKSMDSIDFDVVIVGTGLVGLGVARALAGSGLRLGLVECNRPSSPDSGGWDARVYAISPASEALLRDMSAWPTAAGRMEPVTRMRIFGDRLGRGLG